MNNYFAMTDEEIRNRIRELSDVLNGPIDDNWSKVYTEYTTLSAIQNERYKAENQDKFDAFYAEHIEGKSWDEINPEDWQFYSDWFKDMYGFRPRHI